MMIRTQLLFTIFVIVASVAAGDNGRSIRRKLPAEKTGQTGQTGQTGDDGGAALDEYVLCVDITAAGMSGAAGDVRTSPECDGTSGDFGAPMCCRLHGPPNYLTYDPDNLYPQLPCVCNGATARNPANTPNPAAVTLPIPPPSALSPAVAGDCNRPGSVCQSASDCSAPTECCMKFFCMCQDPETAHNFDSTQCVP